MLGREAKMGTGWQLGSWCVALLAASCVSPLDVLGVDEIVTNRQDFEKPEDLKDDDIADKHPEFDPDRTIVEHFGNCSMELNKSASVTKLDVLPHAASEQALKTRIFPTRTAAFGALAGHELMPSIETVNGALKPFNDGLYAAVELGAEDGSDGSLVDKRAVFQELLQSLIDRATNGTATERPLAGEAAAAMAAAARLGGQTATLPASLVAHSNELESAFQNAPSSKPIGFYTWSPELEAIFRRDRFLQSPKIAAPSFGAFAATAVALGALPSLRDRYEGVLDLYAGVTNPFFHRSVRDLFPFAPDAGALANLTSIQASFASQHPETQGTPACAAHLAFVPASDSPETRLFRQLYCASTGLPEQNLIDVFIARIRSGELDLTPTAESGWYDRQLYALETLLATDRAPEKDHLFLTKRYKEKLIETFKSLVTQNRETHVKQLDTGDVSTSAPAVPVDIYPLLPVEPFPTFYLRTARAYRFLQGVLEASLGPDFLSQSARWIEDGTRSSVSLGAELEQKLTLLYGLYIVASKSIGMDPVLDPQELAQVDPDVAEANARDWLLVWQADPDVARDPRVIVPVETDSNANTTRYWAVIGVKTLRIEAAFYPGFEPKVVAGCPVRDIIPHTSYILVEQQVELSRPADRPPLTRDELRTIASQYDTAVDIVAALESY